MKTIIELFDRSQIQNIIAALSFNTEKIIFVGFKEMMTPDRIRSLEKFFVLRGMNLKLEYQVVGRYDFDSIKDTLNHIVEMNEGCCFDLTGGKELVLAAMGALSAEKKIPMIQFDVRTGRFIRVKNCSEISEPDKVHMTINESVVLNGGYVVNGGNKWDLNEEFRQDTALMWDICRRNCRAWNRQCTTFGGFDSINESEENLSVSISLESAQRMDVDLYINNGIIDYLEEKGIIIGFTNRKNRISFSYKNRQVYKCLTKAGNLLEVYTYMTAVDINRETPQWFSDINTGVVVDWDGEKTGVDTTNEIDVFLMKGLVPVFVSCKNGTVHKEALYELDTVASKFGGKFAGKVIVCTYVNTDSESKKYLLGRAADMNIRIIEGVHNMSREEFTKQIMSADRH